MSEPIPESPPSKEYIRDFNSRAIETAVGEILTMLQNYQIEEFDWFANLEIYNSANQKVSARLQCRSAINGYPDKVYDLIITISTLSAFDQNSSDIATRIFTIKSTTEDGKSNLEADSSMTVADDYKGCYIGSALLHQCERLKFTFASNIGKTLGARTMRSVLFDVSVPVGWTATSARALGYTAVIDEDNKFEKFDDLTKFQIQPPRLVSEWEKRTKRK